MILKFTEYIDQLGSYISVGYVAGIYHNIGMIEKSGYLHKFYPDVGCEFTAHTLEQIVKKLDELNQGESLQNQ